MPAFRQSTLLRIFVSKGSSSALHARCEDAAAAIASGARVVVLDAVYDEDLDRIAAAGLATGLRILWAGSAGLAAALARTLYPARNLILVRSLPGRCCFVSDRITR